MVVSYFERRVELAGDELLGVHMTASEDLVGGAAEQTVASVAVAAVVKADTRQHADEDMVHYSSHAAAVAVDVAAQAYHDWPKGHRYEKWLLVAAAEDVAVELFAGAHLPTESGADHGVFGVERVMQSSKDSGLDNPSCAGAAV